VKKTLVREAGSRLVCGTEEPRIMGLHRLPTLALCILALLIRASAQQNAELYDFQDIKYQVTSWPVNDMMHVLIEKYGMEHAQRTHEYDSLLVYLEKKRFAQDLVEYNDHGAMPPVRKLLGYYPGIKAAAYGQLVGFVEAGKVQKADSILKDLAKAAKDTASADKLVKDIALLSGPKLGSLVQWVNQSNTERANSSFRKTVERLGDGLRGALLDACKDEKGDTCRSALLKVLRSEEAKQRQGHLYRSGPISFGS
jgi:hypothetical protein